VEKLMAGDKKNIAIVPARGGSKRIPKKNLDDLNGAPLLTYTLDVAIKSGVFDKVYVSSEDSEILQVASDFGAHPHERPPELAGDKIFAIDVIKEVLYSEDIPPDTAIGILFATAPLKITEDIVAAWDYFVSIQRSAPVVSVSLYEVPVQLGHYIDKNGRLIPLFPEEYAKSTRSTDHREVYRFNETIIFNTAERLLNQTNLIGINPYPFIMPGERSLTIDEPYQMQFAKSFLAVDRSKKVPGSSK
jgi:N-acylneuraminate cytidylyltransferase